MKLEGKNQWKKRKKKLNQLDWPTKSGYKEKKACMKKKTNEKIEKKSELTGLTLQTRLTSQTWDSRHESLITE